jgi:TatA/E family protein of Tat protein translocase
MNFMGMGWMEISVILIVALIIFGPGKLPEVAGQVGKAVRDFRRMTAELTDEFEKTSGVNVKDIKSTIEQELTGVKSQVTAAGDNLKKEMNSATSTVNSTLSSATSSNKSTSTSTSSTSTFAAKSSTSSSSTKTETPKPRPVATKADPLADLGFFEEIAPISSNGHTNGGPKAVPASTSVVAAASSNGHENGSSVPAKEPVAAGANGSHQDEAMPDDALARARRRRQQAGYGRPLS